MRWAAHGARMGETRSAYSIFVGNPKGERAVGRPRCKWEETIIMDLKKTVWEVVNWIYLAQDRVKWRAFVNAVMDFRTL